MKCVQTCYQCRDEKNQPRKWLWHCVDCVEDNERKHFQDEGHRVEMTLVRDDPSAQQVYGLIADAGRLMGRRGW